MRDGMKVNDTGEEMVIPVGLRGPTGNLLQDLGINSIHTVEAGSVD